ncbi:hypothetical protein [Morganella psychrotolerans]|uniref:hypothetical protein n=1 Tax=Morganella psychrotolerans TaxID=368603 RepID=UPI0039AF716C
MKKNLEKRDVSRVELNVATNQWPESEWGHISNTFYVTVKDADGKAVENAVGTLKFLDDLGEESELITATIVSETAQSNKNGILELQYYLSAIPSPTPVIVDVIATIDDVDSNPVLLEFVSPAKFLAKPNVPAMLDGSIDDSDVEKGIYVYANIAASEDSELYFCWENAVSSYHINAGTDIYSLKIDEGMLENGEHDISFYLVDGVKNAQFSHITVVNIERVDGGGAAELQDLGPVVIVEAEQTGYINKSMSDRGITLKINEWPKLNDADATINEEKTGLISLQGFNKKGDKIGSPQFYTLKADTDFDNKAKTFNPITRAVPSSFFNAIGEGSVQIKYSLNLIEDGKSHTNANANVSKYLVDVIPPARN